ncbi:hypothetical protein [Polynucleobacter sp. JS-JIR-II-b4]|uniref:hypothetical protein n=1 Tax=Polynucleobacter sp. JS-JIR-II-b4 TaxID=1758390 RepID=UPI001BFDCFAD|nr:hypothetical protein [Polynucleobacter sp. JS-JIR-II-b4]QWE02859.1 hypothetical protein ICV90_01850 [Polynucleobacter sp. JS-JIR-II-b4]
MTTITPVATDYLVSSDLRNITLKANAELFYVRQSVVNGVDFGYGSEEFFQVPTMTAGMYANYFTLASTTDLTLYLSTNSSIKSNLRAGYSDAILLDVTNGSFHGEYLIVNTNLIAGFQSGSGGDLVISLTGATNQTDFSVLNFTTVAFGTVLTLDDAIAYNDAGVLPPANAYSITDSAAAIVAAIDEDSTSATILQTARVVSAAGLASASQANTLHSFNYSNIVYSLADTAAHIVSANAGVINAASSVAVTDIATTSQVGTISVQVAQPGSTTYAGITGAATDIVALISGGSPAVVAANVGSISATGTTSVANFHTIQDLHSSSNSFATVAGAYVDITAISSFSSIVNVTISDDISTTQAVSVINNLGNSGTTTVTGVVASTYADFSDAFVSVVSHVGNIFVSDYLTSVHDASIVFGYSNTGTTRFFGVHGTAAELVGGGSLIADSAVYISVSDYATIAQVEILNSYSAVLAEVTLKDTADNLAGASASAFANSASAVVSTDATVAQLQIINNHGAAVVAGYSLADTAAHIADAGTISVSTDRVVADQAVALGAATVDVTTVATTAQVHDIVAAGATASITTYTGITGVATDILSLISGGSPAVLASNVGSIDASGTTSVTDLQAIQTLHSSSNSFATVAGTYIDITEIISFSGIVNVAVSDNDLSVSDAVNAINNLGNSGTTTVAGVVASTYADFSDAFVSAASHVGNIFVSDYMLSVHDAAIIEGYSNTGTTRFFGVHGTAAELVGGGALISDHSIYISVSDYATIAQAEILSSYSAVLAEVTLKDTADNLAGASASAFANSASAVVSTDATVAQLQIINNHGAAVVAGYSLADTAAHIADAGTISVSTDRVVADQAVALGAATVDVTTVATTAQVHDIVAAGATASITTYTGITGVATDILSLISGGSPAVLASNVGSIDASGTTSVTDLQAIHSFGTISDSASSLAGLDFSGYTANSVVATDAATIAQAQTLDGFKTAGEVTTVSYSISDSASALSVSIISPYDGSTHYSQTHTQESIAGGSWVDWRGNLAWSADFGDPTYNINTLPLDLNAPVNNTILYFGGGGSTGVYGETFTAPTSVLNGFTFFINSQDTQVVKAEVFAWSGPLSGSDAGYATGEPLALIDGITLLGDSQYHLVQVSTGLGGIALTPGDHYVVMLFNNNYSDYTVATWAQAPATTLIDQASLNAAYNINITDNIYFDLAAANLVLTATNSGQTVIDSVEDTAYHLAQLTFDSNDHINTLTVNDNCGGHWASLSDAATIASFEVAGKVGSALYDLEDTGSAFYSASMQTLNHASNIQVDGITTAYEAQWVGSITGNLHIDNISDFYTSIQGLLASGGGQYAVTNADYVAAYGDSNANFMDLGAFTGSNTVNLHVYTGAGNDTVYTGAGNDFVQQSDGDFYTVGNDVILTGAGNDTITATFGNDTLTAGTGADTIYVSASRSYQNTIYQGQTDSHIASSFDFSESVIGVGGSIAFNDGVDVIYNFKAGFANDQETIFTGDTLKVDFHYARTIIGESTFDLTHSGYLGVNWDGYVWVAVGEGEYSDSTIILQAGGGEGNTYLGSNLSMVLLEGVNQLDLVNENFGGRSLTAAWNRTAQTYTVYGDAFTGFSMDQYGVMNVQTRYLGGIFNESSVKSIDFSGVTLQETYGGSIYIDVVGSVSSQLQAVTGSAYNDIIVESSTDIGADYSYIDGGAGGYDIVEFQSFDSATFVLLGNATSGSQIQIANIDRITLTNGTTGTLTLGDSDQLDNIQVRNLASYQGASVDLGSGYNNGFVDYAYSETMGGAAGNEIFMRGESQYVDIAHGDNIVNLQSNVNYYDSSINFGDGNNTLNVETGDRIVETSITVNNGGTWVLNLAEGATFYTATDKLIGDYATSDITGGGSGSVANVYTGYGALTNYTLDANVHSWGIGSYINGDNWGGNNNDVTLGTLFQTVVAGDGNDTLHALDFNINGDIDLGGGQNTLILTGSNQDISSAGISVSDSGTTALEINAQNYLVTAVGTWYIDSGANTAETDAYEGYVSVMGQSFSTVSDATYHVSYHVDNTYSNQTGAALAIEINGDVKQLSYNVETGDYNFDFIGTGYDNIAVVGFDIPSGFSVSNFVISGEDSGFTNGNFADGDLHWTDYSPEAVQYQSIFTDYFASFTQMTVGQYEIFEDAGLINAHDRFSTTTISFTNTSTNSDVLDANIGNWILGGGEDDYNTFTVGQVEQSVTGSQANDRLILDDAGSYSGTFALQAGINTMVLHDGVSIIDASISADSGSGSWTLEVAQFSTAQAASYQLQAAGHAYSVVGDGAVGEQNLDVNTGYYYGGALGASGGYDSYVLASSVGDWGVGISYFTGADLGNGDNRVTLSTDTAPNNAQNVRFGSGDDTLDVLSYATSGSFDLGYGYNIIHADNGADISASTVTAAGSWILEFGHDAGVTISTAEAYSMLEMDTISGSVMTTDGVNTLTVNTTENALQYYYLAANVPNWNIGVDSVGNDLGAGDNVVGLRSDPIVSLDNYQNVNFGGGDDELYIGHYITHGDFNLGAGTNTIFADNGANIVDSFVYSSNRVEGSVTAGTWTILIQGEDSVVTVATDHLIYILDASDHASGIETEYSYLTSNATVVVDTNEYGALTNYNLDTSVANWYIGIDTSFALLGLGDNSVGLDLTEGSNSQNVYFGSGTDTITLNADGQYSGTIDMGLIDAGSVNTITANASGTYDLRLAQLSNINLLNTASTGAFAYELSANDVYNIDQITFNADEAATLYLTSGLYDFSSTGTGLTFGASGSTLDLDTYGNTDNTDVTLTGAEVINLSTIVGQSDALDYDTTLTFVDSADLSGKTVSDVQTVIESGSADTLTLGIDGFTSSNYNHIHNTGSADNQLTLSGTIDADLTNTWIEAFTQINTAMGDHLITVDSSTITGTDGEVLGDSVTWSGDAATNFLFTQTYDASAWSLTEGDFANINLSSDVDLIVRDTFLSSTVMFQVGSNNIVTINYVGDNEGHRQYVAAEGTTNDGQVIITSADEGAHVDVSAASASDSLSGEWTMVGGTGNDYFKGSSNGHTTFEFASGVLNNNDYVIGGGSSNQNRILLTTHADYYGASTDIADSDFINVDNVNYLFTVDGWGSQGAGGWSSDSIQLATFAQEAGIRVLDASNTNTGVIFLAGGYISADLTVELSQNTTTFNAEGGGASPYGSAFNSNLIVNFDGHGDPSNGTNIYTGNGDDTVNADLGGENIHTGIGDDVINMSYGANLYDTSIDGGSDYNTLVVHTYNPNSSNINGSDLYDSSFSYMSNLQELVLNNNGDYQNYQWVQLGSQASSAFAENGMILTAQGVGQLEVQGASLSVNLTAGGTYNNSFTYNDIYDETIVSGSGRDTIYGAGAYSSITANTNADTVILDPLTFDYSSYYSNDVNQGEQDSLVATSIVIAGEDNVIAVGDTLTFGEGVDIVNNFRAGITDVDSGNGYAANIDILYTNQFTTVQYVLGMNASSLSHGGILAGNFAGGIFTVAAYDDAAALDTLVIQSSGGDNYNLSTNNSMVVLTGVKASELTSWNFGGQGIVANYTSTIYTIWGSSTDVVVVDTALDGHNVESYDVFYINSYVAADVTVISATNLFYDFANERYDGGSPGVTLHIDGTVTTNLTEVDGTRYGDNTFIFANETMGSSSGFQLYGGYEGAGFNKLQFTTFAQGTLSDSNAGLGNHIYDIHEIDLMSGTTGDGLVLNQTTNDWYGLNGIDVYNKSNFANVTVDLGNATNATMNSSTSGTVRINLGNYTQSAYLSGDSGSDYVSLTDTTDSYYGDIQFGSNVSASNNTLFLNDGVNIDQAHITAASEAWTLEVAADASVRVNAWQLVGPNEATVVVGGNMNTTISVNTDANADFSHWLVDYSLAYSVGNWYIGITPDNESIGLGNNSVTLRSENDSVGGSTGPNSQSVYMGGGNSYINSIYVQAFTTDGDFSFGNSNGTIIADDGADISLSGVSASYRWTLEFNQTDAAVTVSSDEANSVYQYTTDGDNTVTVNTVDGPLTNAFGLASNVLNWNIGATAAGDDFAPAIDNANSVALGAANQNVKFGSGDDTLSVGGYSTTGDFNLRAGNNTITAYDGANIAGSAVLATGGDWTLAITGEDAAVTVNSSQLQLDTSGGGNVSDVLTDITATFGDSVVVDTSVTGLNGYALDYSVENWFIGITTALDPLGINASSVSLQSESGSSNSQNVTFADQGDTLNVGAYTTSGTFSMHGGDNIIQAANGADISGSSVTTTGAGTWELEFTETDAGVTISTAEANSVHQYTNDGDNTVTVNTAGGPLIDAFVLASNVRYWNIGATAGGVDFAPAIDNANSVALGADNQFVDFGSGDDTLGVGNYATSGNFNLRAGDNTITAINGANIAGSTVLATEGTWTLAIAEEYATVTVNVSQLQFVDEAGASDVVDNITTMTGDIVIVNTDVHGRSLVDYDLLSNVLKWGIGIEYWGSALGYGNNSVNLTNSDLSVDNYQSVHMDGVGAVNSVNVGAFTTYGELCFGASTATVFASDTADISHSYMSQYGDGTWTLEFTSVDAGVTISTTQAESVYAYTNDGTSNTITVNTSVGGALNDGSGGAFGLASNVKNWNIGATADGTDLGAQNNFVQITSDVLLANAQNVSSGSGNDTLSVLNYTTSGNFNLRGGDNIVSAIDGANIAGSTVLATGGGWTLAFAATSATVTVNSSQLQSSELDGASQVLADITTMSGDILQVDTSIFGALTDYNLNANVASWFIGTDSSLASLGNGDNTVNINSMVADLNTQSVTFGEGSDTLNLNADGAYTGNINMRDGLNTLHTDYNADVSGATLAKIQNVTIGDSTLIVKQNQFTTTNFLSVIGNGSTLTVMSDLVSSVFDLTNTAMSGLSQLNVSDLGAQTVLFDGLSIDTSDEITLVGGQSADKTNLEFSETYDASNWSLVNQEFANVTLDTSVHLTADQSFLSDSNTSVTFLIGSNVDATAHLTLNSISNYVATSGTSNFGTADLNTAGTNSIIDLHNAYQDTVDGLTNGWNITGGNGAETIIGSADSDTILITGTGSKVIEGYKGADTISTAGLTHSSANIFYQHFDDSIEQTFAQLGGAGVNVGKVVVGNFLDFAAGVDIINGFNTGIDQIGISNYTLNENATSILNTRIGNSVLFSAGGLYKLEGNWDASAMRFTVTADGGGSDGGGHTFATAIIEGVSGTNLLNTASIVLLVGVHDTALTSGNFNAIPG